MNEHRIDTEEWRRWLVNYGFTEDEAYVFVKLRVGYDRAEIADELEVEEEEVARVIASVLEQFRDVRDTFCLLLAPKEFWYSPGAYPETEAEVERNLQFRGLESQDRYVG